jgi:hypothetical protein
LAHVELRQRCREYLFVNDVEVGSLTGFGGELGSRFYTGSKGATGFFAGPSVLFASCSSSPVRGGASQSFTSLGGAVDIGGQFIIGPGVVLGSAAAPVHEEQRGLATAPHEHAAPWLSFVSVGDWILNRVKAEPSKTYAEPRYGRHSPTYFVSESA